MCPGSMIVKWASNTRSGRGPRAARRLAASPYRFFRDFGVCLLRRVGAPMALRLRLALAAFGNHLKAQATGDRRNLKQLHFHLIAKLESFTRALPDQGMQSHPNTRNNPNPNSRPE